MPVQTDMVDRIRRSLERSGPARTNLAGLLSSWSVDVSDHDARRDLTDRLADAGIACEPPLEDIEAPDSAVVLRLGDRETLRAARPHLVAAAAEAPAARSGSLWAGDAEPVRRGPIRAGEDVPEPLVRSAPAPEAEPEPEPERAPDSDRWFDLERDLRRMHLPFLGLGALLVIGCLIMPWYSAQRDGNEVADLSIGWEWLSVLDIYLFVLGFACWGLLALVIARQRELAMWVARGLLAACAIAVVMTCYRSVKAPFDAINDFVVLVHPKAGPYVGVVGSMMLFLGTFYLAGFVPYVQRAWSGITGVRPAGVSLPRRRAKDPGSDATT